MNRVIVINRRRVHAKSTDWVPQPLETCVCVSSCSSHAFIALNVLFLSNNIVKKNCATEMEKHNELNTNTHGSTTHFVSVFPANIWENVQCTRVKHCCFFYFTSSFFILRSAFFFLVCCSFGNDFVYFHCAFTIFLSVFHVCFVAFHLDI